MDYSFKKYGRSIISTGVMLFAFFTAAFAQAFTVYDTSNSGIPENTVRALALDHSGNLWVGTENGAALFDGTNWTVYQTSNSGLSENYLRSILIAPDSNVWFGTLNGGLDRFDGTNWSNLNMFNSPMPENHVRVLANDSASGIWAGTVGGLARINDTVTTVYNMFNSILFSDNIASLFITGADSFWAGTVNGGMVIVKDTSWTLFTNLNSGIHDNTIFGIAVEPTGRGWLATPAAGIVQYAGTFVEYNSVNSAIPTNALKCIDQATNMHLWIGSYNRGIIHFDGISDFEWFDHLNSPMPDSIVNTILYDPGRNVVWAGTFTGGLVKLDIDLLNSWREENPRPQVLMYPNPFDSWMKIDVKGTTARYALVEMFDISGKQVLYNQVSIEQGFAVIPAEYISRGFYLARVEVPGENPAWFRMIKK